MINLYSLSIGAFYPVLSFVLPRLHVQQSDWVIGFFFSLLYSFLCLRSGLHLNSSRMHGSSFEGELFFKVYILHQLMDLCKMFIMMPRNALFQNLVLHHVLSIGAVFLFLISGRYHPLVLIVSTASRFMEQEH